jgi:hypothetical protein
VRPRLDSRAPTVPGRTRRPTTCRQDRLRLLPIPDARELVTDIALRAKSWIGVVRRFVARHTDAVVLDLGAVWTPV